VLTTQRKQRILERLRRDGQIIAKALSQEWDLSEDTIRRDLRELASEGLLQRVHGGALPSSPATADFAKRQTLAHAGKAAIGRAASQLIQPGQVVIVDGGTTAVQLAKHIPLELNATIITHSPSIAVELAQHPHLEIILIGGKLFKHSVVSVGASALEQIQSLHADLFFMGVTSLHPEIGLTTGDFEEARIKQALSRHAAETIVLASSEKIGTAAPYQVVPLRAVGQIITEKNVPTEQLEPYRALGITVLQT
jgi:DeoR/GlpR family transcriptional regulator of sugar metabolism